MSARLFSAIVCLLAIPMVGTCGGATDPGLVQPLPGFTLSVREAGVGGSAATLAATLGPENQPPHEQPPLVLPALEIKGPANLVTSAEPTPQPGTAAPASPEKGAVGRGLPEQSPTPRPVHSPAELTLQELVQLTLSANPDLQAAAERTRIAEKTLARARTEFFPTLSLGQEYLAADNPLNVFQFLAQQSRFGPQTIFNLPKLEDNFHTQFKIEQEFYSGGLRLARLRSASAEHAFTHYGLAALQNRLLYSVAEAYFRLFQARDLVKVRREAMGLAERQLKVVEARFRAQKAVKSDILQVESRLAETREAYITAITQEELSWAILENVVGVPLAGRQLPAQLPEIPWCRQQAGEVDAAVAEALQKRPEVGQINSQIEAASHQIRAAEAGKYPTFGVLATYDVYTGDLRTAENSFFLGMAFNLKLMDSGRTRVAVHQAQARFREVTSQSRRVHLDIELEVRRAHLQLKDARERLKVATSAVQNATERLRLVEVQYQNQTATLTQVIEAQVSLTDAQVRHTNAQVEILVAQAILWPGLWATWQRNDSLGFFGNGSTCSLLTAG